MKPRQRRLMEEHLPRLAVPADGPLDLAALFPGANEIWLEVGFGGGEHLAWQAAENPDIGFIGAEPFVNGVAKLLVEIEERGLENIRILHGDVRPLLERLPAACLGRMFVLFPDPWPKARHHKRRIVSPWFLDAASRALRPGGELRIASDIPDYIRWTLQHMAGRSDFQWTAEAPSDWRGRPDDWPETRYEAKAVRAGRTSACLTFKKS